jgi:hypothetical protein
VQGDQSAGDARVGETVEQPAAAACVGDQMAQQANEQDVASAVEQQRLAAARLVQFGTHQADDLFQRCIGLRQGHHHGLPKFGHEQRCHRSVQVRSRAQQFQGQTDVILRWNELVRSAGAADHHGRGRHEQRLGALSLQLHTAVQHQMQPQHVRRRICKPQGAVRVPGAHHFHTRGKSAEQGRQSIKAHGVGYWYELQRKMND